VPDGSGRQWAGARCPRGAFAVAFAVTTPEVEV
jgi:hypothetical protein